MVILWRWSTESDRVEVAIVVKMHGDFSRALWEPEVAPFGMHWGRTGKGDFHGFIIDKAVCDFGRARRKDRFASGGDPGVREMILNLTRDPPRS